MPRKFRYSDDFIRTKIADRIVLLGTAIAHAKIPIETAIEMFWSLPANYRPKQLEREIEKWLHDKQQLKK